MVILIPFRKAERLSDLIYANVHWGAQTSSFCVLRLAYQQQMFPPSSIPKAKHLLWHSWSRCGYKCNMEISNRSEQFSASTLVFHLILELHCSCPLKVTLCRCYIIYCLYTFLVSGCLRCSAAAWSILLFIVFSQGKANMEDACKNWCIDHRDYYATDLHT